MHITPEEIVKLRRLLIDGGFIHAPADPDAELSSEWDADMQMGYDAYLRAHEDELVDKMLGQQPGKIEQLGQVLQHAFDKGVSIFEAWEHKLAGGFSAFKENVGDEVGEAKENLSKAAKQAKKDAEELADKAKAAAAAAEAELSKKKGAASESTDTEGADSSKSDDSAGSKTISIDRKGDGKK